MGTRSPIHFRSWFRATFVLTCLNCPNMPIGTYCVSEDLYESRSKTLSATASGNTRFKKNTHGFERAKNPGPRKRA